MTMRICLVARRFYESNTHMQQFAKALANRGDIVDVIAVRKPGSPRYEQYHGVNVYRVQTRYADEGLGLVYLLKVIQFLFWATIRIGIRHFRQPYDVVHVQSIPDLLVFSAAVPKLLKTPVILDLRDLVPELSVSKFKLADDSLIARTLLLVEKCSAAFADHVIVANPIWYERVVSRSADRSKCTMIWYSPDPAVFRRRDNSPNHGKFVMMYPGTLSWHQGVDIAIRALPKIRAAIPTAELHIYAEGSSRGSLAILAEELGLQESIRFFDVIPTETLVERMSHCDVAIAPKRASDRFGNEAASTKIPEFMAVGVPVVASRTAIEGCLFDGSELCYFTSEDQDDFVRAILSVHNDPDLRDCLSSNASKKIESTFHDIQRQYVNLVDSLAMRKRRSSQKMLPAEHR
jgi:glycosyltransferase involved in cell wall biosynthesis